MGHEVIAQGRLGARPARSSMTMVMNAWGSWKPRALVRSRPMDALFGLHRRVGAHARSDWALMV